MPETPFPVLRVAVVVRRGVIEEVVTSFPCEVVILDYDDLASSDTLETWQSLLDLNFQHLEPGQPEKTWQTFLTQVREALEWYEGAPPGDIPEEDLHA
jgi:hypothetical protein